MIHSMTGYGLITRTLAGFQVMIQIKSVNTKYLDIFVRFSGISVDFEQEIRSRINTSLNRGRVDLMVGVSSPEGDIKGINIEAASRYLEQLKNVKKTLHLDENIRLQDILSLPGILESMEQAVYTDEEFQAGFLELLDEALEQLTAMRTEEGRNLASVIMDRFSIITQDLETIAAAQDQNRRYYQERLQKRLGELLEGREPLDEVRLNQEVAYLADRSDIAEEVDRFRSHMGQFEKTMEGGSPAGKKLDFILQELNREINTILSKSEIQDIKRRGINIKSELEKIREQVQNIE